MVKFDGEEAKNGTGSSFLSGTMLGRAASAASSTYSRESNKMESKQSAPRKTRMEYEHMAGKVLQQHQAATLNTDEWSWERLFLYNILEDHVYSGVMGTIIMLNTLLVIHETDLRASGPGVPGWIQIASNVFLSVYSFEIAVRFYVLRKDFFRSIWNWLDLMIVITDCCTEVAKAGGLDNSPSVSVLRIFRLMRLVRLIATLAVFQELQTMLLGFGSAMKAILWASMLIFVVLTVCSIVAVMLIHPLNQEVAKTGAYGDCDRCGRAFETVAEANLTFMQQIIAGDSWGTVTIPIIEAYPAAGVFFLVVFCVIDLGVINLVLMVIVNAAEAAREANEDIQFKKKLRQIQEMKDKLKHICQSLDADQDGTFSLKEFMDGFDNNEELEIIMAELDIQRQDADIIFFLMDEDGNGTIDVNEFIGTMVETKHESLNTKLLFLKADLHQLKSDLHDQQRFLKQGIAPKLMSTPQVAQVVDASVNEANAKTGLQWEKVMGECQSLVEKLDQRWEQLQIDQSKNCQMLEKVASEMLLPLSSRSTTKVQSEPQASARESTLSSLSMPSSCAPCKVLEGKVGNTASSDPAHEISQETGFNVPEQSPVPNWDVDLVLYKTKRCGE